MSRDTIEIEFVRDDDLGRPHRLLVNVGTELDQGYADVAKRGRVLTRDGELVDDQCPICHGRGGLFDNKSCPAQCKSGRIPIVIDLDLDEQVAAIRAYRKVLEIQDSMARERREAVRRGK